MGETGSLEAEYIEKRGWFPGQSGSQTYGYEGGVSLGQVLGYMWSSGPGPHPHSWAVKVFTQRKFGSFLHPNIQVEQKGVLCWQGWGCSIQQILGVSGRGLPRAGPLATPALAVAELSHPKAVSRRMLYWPHWGVCPSTSHPNSMLESQRVKAPGGKQTPRLQSSSPRPAPFSRL